ncbi:hypothetical protein QR680_000445 [Steinernema hermaphroditum]|uniref:Uncharacterized protein n=1 Tax=Steinernema hermaphroditum TaxID=289476 RepID=A0AA39LEA7_9BILA|nr:hypothetical protein QR680_000445 [Steinernema hermaphroditum]
MHLLLAILIVASTTVSSTETVPAKPVSDEVRIQCSQSVFCSEYNRTTFLTHRMWARHFIKQYKFGQLNIGNFSVDGHKYYDILCTDATTTGFMLEEGAEKWPMACVRNGAGASANSSCAPYPFEGESVYEFCEVDEWRSAVENFRLQIGCSKEQVEGVKNIDENYFCRERCNGLGLGDVPYIIMFASVVGALILSL